MTDLSKDHILARHNTLPPAELNASEALYGFVAWLTTRQQTTTFSSRHGVEEGLDMVKRFCFANDLSDPRDGWSTHLHPVVEDAPPPADTRSPMRQVIDRLFAEAPKLLDETGEPRTDQAPALECTVSLRRGVEIAGSLSVTPEGTFRILSKANVPPGHPLERKPVMLETFFAPDEISSLTLIRELTMEESEIARGGSRIIAPS